MMHGYGYIVETMDGRTERYASLQKIADAYIMTLPTIAYWYYHGKVSEMGREANIKAIRRDR